MQRVAKKAGRPWDCSKGFDGSGPVGALTPAAGDGSGAGDGKGIWLKVDGVLRQKSVLGEMVWSVPEMIARLSEVRAWIIYRKFGPYSGVNMFAYAWCSSSAVCRAFSSDVLVASRDPAAQCRSVVTPYSIFSGPLLVLCGELVLHTFRKPSTVDRQFELGFAQVFPPLFVGRSRVRSGQINSTAVSVHKIVDSAAR